MLAVPSAIDEMDEIEPACHHRIVNQPGPLTFNDTSIDFDLSIIVRILATMLSNYEFSTECDH